MESPAKFTFWCCSGCGAEHKTPRGVCSCGVNLAGMSREDFRYMRVADLAALHYSCRLAGNPSPWDVSLTPSAATERPQTPQSSQP